MAQKVSNLDQKTTKAMFDPEGYVPIIKQGEQVARFKVVKDWTKKGKRKAEDTKCTLVLTFDKKRQKRDLDRKSTRLNSSHTDSSRMPSSA